MNEKPFKLDMSFEEAMRRLGRVNKQPLDSAEDSAAENGATPQDSAESVDNQAEKLDKRAGTG